MHLERTRLYKTADILDFCNFYSMKNQVITPSKQLFMEMFKDN